MATRDVGGLSQTIYPLVDRHFLGTRCYGQRLHGRHYNDHLLTVGIERRNDGASDRHFGPAAQCRNAGNQTRYAKLFARETSLVPTGRGVLLPRLSGSD